MIQMILVGLGAGLAAALLFLAPVSGTILAFPLFALTGLPIAIAAIGWGTQAGILAGITGTLVILALFPGGTAPIIFLILFAVPLVWLARYVSMFRETDGEREWFPAGGILVRTTVVVGIAIALSGIATGFDPQTVTQDASSAVAEWMARSAGAQPAPDVSEIEAVMRLYVSIMPALLALLMVAITLLDLWLASLITRASGRLERPRGQLWTVSIPNQVLGAFAVALVLAFLPGAVGNVAAVFAGAFLAALVAVGLAVFHALTLGMGARVPLLVATYLLLFISGLPVIILAILGAGENFFRLRARRFAGSSGSQ